MNNIEKTLDRIQKLLRLSKSKNVNEAAAAAAQAQKIMHKYNLTMYMVEAFAASQDISSEEIYDFTKIGEPLVAFSKNISTWKTRLASLVSYTNHCRIYINKSSPPCLGLVGRKNDADTVRYLFHYLVKEIDRLTKKLTIGKDRIWKNNFRLGAVEEIGRRLNEALKESKNSFQKTAKDNKVDSFTVSSAIQKFENRGELVEEFIKENLNLSNSKYTSYKYNKLAQQQGASAAKTINLNTGKSLEGKNNFLLNN